MCHHSEKSKNSFSNSHTATAGTSYFCDNGTRSSHYCNDYLNIYDGMNTPNSPISFVLMKNLCGIGRLPKIVTKKNSLVLEFNSASNGYFVNSGFLFYAMNQRK